MARLNYIDDTRRAVQRMLRVAPNGLTRLQISNLLSEYSSNVRGCWSSYHTIQQFEKEGWLEIGKTKGKQLQFRLAGQLTPQTPESRPLRYKWEPLRSPFPGPKIFPEHGR